MGIPARFDSGILIGGSHSEFVHIGPPKGNGTGFAQLPDDGGVVGSGVFAGENFGSTAAGLPFHIDEILDRNRDSAERQGKICFFGIG